LDQYSSLQTDKAAIVFNVLKCGQSIVILLEQKKRTMDATYNFSLGFAQEGKSKTETPNPLFNRQTLQMISTGVSLVSLSLGFSIFGILIIVNQHQADLNDLSGGGSCATVGGIGAILVGTAFLVAAWLHWRCCAPPVRKSARAVAYPRSHSGRSQGACRNMPLAHIA
jgi:hypothetical protein